MRVSLACALLLAANTGAAQMASRIATTTDITAKDLRARLFLLADDSMEGREPGAIGNFKAAEYIASEFKRLGLKPGGDDGTYFQQVPFVREQLDDKAMLEALLGARPAVVSFHFGLPPVDRIARLKAAGIVLLATVTSLAEAQAAGAAGIDAVVAQGWEAGGHRGAFDPDRDSRLGTFALVRRLTRGQGLPVIAAGGIMDGAGVAAALALGAEAAQLGTAFVGCPEARPDEFDAKKFWEADAAKRSGR